MQGSEPDPVFVAGLGDAAKASSAPGAVFAGCDAQPGHELARMIEARQIAELGDQADGDGELHAAQVLDGLHHRILAACGRRFAQSRLQIRKTLHRPEVTDDFRQVDRAPQHRQSYCTSVVDT